MAEHPTITLTLDGDGLLAVNSNVDDPLILVGMLELGKSFILGRRPAPRPALVPVHGSLTPNGR